MPGKLRAGLLVSAGRIASAGPSRPAGSAGLLLDLAARSEAAGFDAFFVAPPRSGGIEPARDPFVLLGAISMRAERLLLGAAIDSGTRPPGVLAKAVASLDVCSRGRAVHLLVPVRDCPDWEDRLVEELLICRLMLRVPAPSFEGVHHRIQSAWNEPLARRLDPTPVGLVVGLAGGLEQETAFLVALAARYCEIVVLDLTGVPAAKLGGRLQSADAALATALAKEGRGGRSLRRLALLEPSRAAEREATAAVALECRRSCDAILIRFETETETEASVEELSAWRQLVAPDDQGSGSSSSSAR